MSSKKVIDIANSLEFIRDYNSNGITGSNSRLSTSENGELFLYYNNSSSNSSSGTLVLYNGGLSINNTSQATSVSSGGSMTIRGGTAIGGDLYIGSNVYVSSNISTTNVISSGLTVGNINFTGNLYQNSSLYVSSQWTSNTNSSSVFYTSGNVGINTTQPQYNLDVNGTMRSNNILSTDITSGSLTATGLTVGNINFTGNLYQNGVLYSESNSGNWGTDSNNIFYTRGNVGIMTTSPNSTLDVLGNFNVSGSTSLSSISSIKNGNVLTIQNFSTDGNSSIQFMDNSSSNRLYIGYANNSSSLTNFAGFGYILSENATSIKIAAGNNTSQPIIINANDNSISVTTTTESTDIYSGSLKVAGGVGIEKNLYVGGLSYLSNLNVTNVTYGSLSISDLNLGMSNIFSNVFVASNNVGSATNITNLFFSNSTVRSFTVTLAVSVTATTNLYETFILEGIQRSSQWDIYINSYGDITGVLFSITSSGQIQYTSPNFSGFTNMIFSYQVVQINKTVSVNYLGLSTSGTLIIDSIQILSTVDSNSITKGSLYIAGGCTIDKTLYSTNISSDSLIVTTGTVGTVRITTSLMALGNSNTIGSIVTTGGNVGFGTLYPAGPLHISGTTNRSSSTIGGIYMGTMNDNYAFIQLNSTTGTRIDFSNVGSNYRGRIVYDNSLDCLDIHTNGTISSRLNSIGNLTVVGDLTVFGNISDARLKHNVHTLDLDESIDIVNRLRPVTFTWNDDISNTCKKNTDDVGFIAQEVEDVIKYAVDEFQDIQTEKMYKKLKHERIIPYLVGAIQKLETDNKINTGQLKQLQEQLQQTTEQLQQTREQLQQTREQLQQTREQFKISL
jgi:hypothetical protein